MSTPKKGQSQRSNHPAFWLAKSVSRASGPLLRRPLGCHAHVQGPELQPRSCPQSSFLLTQNLRSSSTLVQSLMRKSWTERLYPIFPALNVVNRWLESEPEGRSVLYEIIFLKVRTKWGNNQIPWRDLEGPWSAGFMASLTHLKSLYPTKNCSSYGPGS